jgi:hypothetical protein
MNQYTYHSGPLAEVKTVITGSTGRTVVFTYTPPMSGALSPLEIPAKVEIKFENGAVLSFCAKTGQWLSVMHQEEEPRKKSP